MDQFTASSCIRFGWETFKKRPWFFIAIYVITGLVSFNYSYRSEVGDVHLSAGLVVAFIIVGIALFFLENVVAMGKTRILLKAEAGVVPLTLRDLWTLHPFWRFWLGKFLVGLIVFVGLLLLIVPGIIFSLMYMFVPYLIMDKGMKPLDAIRESRRITNGHKRQLFTFCLALVGINILGFLCLIVGLFVSIPVSALATAHAYRFFQKQAKTDAPEDSPFSVA